MAEIQLAKAELEKELRKLEAEVAISKVTNPSLDEYMKKYADTFDKIQDIQDKILTLQKKTLVIQSFILLLAVLLMP